MTLDQLHALQSVDGIRLLAQLASEPLADDDVLPVIARYRQEYPTPLVQAAVELSRLRRRAAGKFARAGDMFFTREGLEMASADLVARHTACRFAGLGLVYDLCCGLGGDALALAEVAGQVVAVDRDPLMLAMAAANAQAYGRTLTCIEADVTADLPTIPGPPAAIFIDPSRRESRAAARRPEAYAPPLSWCLGLTRLAPRVAIKVSPALDYLALDDLHAEVEVISLRGEGKEIVLWLGAFVTCARRATVLPAGATLTEAGPTTEALGAVGAWLYEPDPAVIRAQLVQRLAGEYGLWRIDPEIAYLTGDREVSSPYLVGYRVRTVIPWGLKRLNAALTAQRVGQVVIKKRGFPLTPEALRPKLKLSGAGKATLICTRVAGDPVVILAE